MPILHGAGLSPFVRKVRVAMAEKSIEYDHNPLIPFGVSDEYKKKSPLGKIPCYEDGDFVLPDSSCIIAYLERSQPNPALYPSDPKQFARALWYEEYADSKVTEVMTTIFAERIIKGLLMKGQPDEEKIAKVAAEGQPPVFDYLEGEIGDNEAIVGGRFSVADIALASSFVNFAHGGGELDAGRWPKLVAYIERIHSRPSFKALIEEEKGFVASMRG